MMIVQFIIFQIIVFGAVIYFLKKILYGDTESAINRLGHVYQDLLNKQAELAQKIEGAEKEYEQKKEEGNTIVEKMKNEAMDEVHKKEDELLKRARGEAEEIISKAESSRDEYYRQIEANVSKKMVDLIADLLAGIFTPKTLQSIHEEMLRDFIDRAKSFDLSSVDLTVDHMIIRTPFPLRKEETERINALVVSKLNRPIQLQELADPDLAAGVILQFGTLVLDGSLMNAIKENAMRLKEKIASRA